LASSTGLGTRSRRRTKERQRERAESARQVAAEMPPVEPG
jgi:hypothetical protein